MPTGTDLCILAVRDGFGHFGAKMRRAHEVIGEGDHPAWHRNSPQRVTAVGAEVDRILPAGSRPSGGGQLIDVQP